MDPVASVCARDKCKRLRRLRQSESTTPWPPTMRASSFRATPLEPQWLSRLLKLRFGPLSHPLRSEFGLHFPMDLSVELFDHRRVWSLPRKLPCLLLRSPPP